MSYVFHDSDAEHLSKHGIDLTIYNENLPSVNVVRVHVDCGHFEEFYDKVSDYVYSVVSGDGTFMLNDEKHEVTAGDLVVVPAGTRIHYFGTMDMVLSVAPAFDTKNEVHVRFIDKSENPYFKDTP